MCMDVERFNLVVQMLGLSGDVIRGDVHKMGEDERYQRDGVVEDCAWNFLLMEGSPCSSFVPPAVRELIRGSCSIADTGDTNQRIGSYPNPTLGAWILYCLSLNAFESSPPMSVELRALDLGSFKCLFFPRENSRPQFLRRASLLNSLYPLIRRASLLKTLYPVSSPAMVICLSKHQATNPPEKPFTI